MKIKNIILGLLLFLSLFSFGQNNLIHNANVDQPTNVASPFHRGFVDFYNADDADDHSHEDLSVWESRLKIRGQELLHSPDWCMINHFDNGDGIPRIKYRLMENGVLQPHSGLGYVLMGPGELIQQKFFDANKFEEGKSYTLNFYIRTYNVGSNWSSGLDLNVYFRKTKMKYSFSANLKTNKCDPSKYFNKKNTNNTIQILNKPIDLSNYSTGEWFPITVEFIAPSSDYDWIIIETESENLCHPPKLLLDDFSLTKTCELPSCDRTTGEVFPHHTGLITNSTPLKIDNLNNVSEVTVEILNSIGQTSIWSYSASCTNGINEPIFWDGKNYNNAYVANSVYLLKTTYTNSCGTATKISQVLKNGDAPPVINDINCNNSGVETPVPCCVYEPNLTIDNISLPGPEILEYEVINTINVAPIGNVSVQSNGYVEMKAGTEIILNSGFTILNGGDYLGQITPCVKLLNNHVELNYLTTKKDNIEEIEEDLEIENTIEIFPNPTSKSATLFIKDYISNDYYKVEIYNTQNLLMSSFIVNNQNSQIDLNNFSKGLYILKISNGIQNKFIKLLKI